MRSKAGVLRRGVPAVLARQHQGGGGDARARGLALAEIARAGAVLLDAGGEGEGEEKSGENGGVSVSSCELLPSRGRVSPPRTKVRLRVSGELARPFLFSSGGKSSSLEIEAELRLFGGHQAGNAAAAAAAALSLSLPASFSSSDSSNLDLDLDLLRRRRAIAGRITPDAVSRGLSGATLPGRFQVARLPLANGGVRWSGRGGESDGGGESSSSSSPSLAHLTSHPSSSSSSSSASSPLSSIPIVLDGAHTPDSAAALARALRAAWPGSGPNKKQPKLGIVLACASDKDLRGIAAALRSPPSSLLLKEEEENSSSLPPPPLRPSVVVFTEVPVAGGHARSAPSGELAAAWQAAVGAEPFAGPSGRCRALLKASLGAAVDAAARELTAGMSAGDEEDSAVLVVTGSLHAVGEALRVLPLEEVVGV